MCGHGASVVLLALTSLAAVHQCIGATSFKRVCYYTSWSQYRPSGATFLPGDIDPYLCTHIIYSFYLFNWDTWDLRADEWNAASLISGLTALRNSNKELKIMIAVGGFNFGSPAFSYMANTTASRAAFISSTLTTLSRYSLNGLDLDWEYPGTRGGTAKDKENFALLCQELKRAFEPYGYLLTAAVPAGYQNIYAGHSTEAAQYLDFVNVMGYDYYGPWDATTGHNAPLYSREDDLDKRFTLTETLRIYNQELGIPKSKIIVGMPTYGHTWTLTNPSQTGPRSPGTPGPATTYVKTPGVIAYFEVCNNSSFQRVFDDVALVPYAVFGSMWVSYDDVVSIAIKTDMVINQGYGGVMFWTLDLDDFNNVCGGGRFTLINSAKNRLLDATPTASTSRTTSTTTTTTTTTPTTTSPTTATATTTTTTTTTTATTSTRTTTTTTTPNTTTTSPTTTSTTTTTTPTTTTTTPPTTSTTTTTTPTTTTTTPTTTSTTPTTTSTTTTTTTTTTTATPPTNFFTGEPSDDVECDYYTDPSHAYNRWWYYANPDDCGQYRFCFGEVLCLALMNCPPGTLWDHIALTCEHADKVTCACAERND